MRQMESQIQQLLERTGEEAEKKVAEEVEQQVATRVAAAIQKLEVGESLIILLLHALHRTCHIYKTEDWFKKTYW